ncbi:SIS domain-containing protein [Actinopolymorpha pittospori]|uniref:Fructoselysine-6-P-deglycase FrlB-like protein n=1 Tax=Actinopolymorpha pittospori TaxID=648752 RepID=A0A927RCN5_9ACTN|nr:sugar isomerase [Actinopolymorpha pittospori]MBE1607275.1 fructoselysine-6-P-deglycase FrlB-like protein [Actinopolymorpha pittospori]
MSSYAQEVRSQPELWRQASALATTATHHLPPHGARLAVAGCGTSLFIADAFAQLREGRGHGETDALVPTADRVTRAYEAVLALSRSGTTTEVTNWLEAQAPALDRYALVGVAGTPVARAAPNPLVLDFADERSIVQTRFATSTLALLRASLGEDVLPLADGAEAVLAKGAPFDAGRFDHFVFLGEGFASALSQEAALKMRETTGAWTEAYLASEYRHGPVSAATSRTLVWVLGQVPAHVLDHVRESDATVWTTGEDPMVELVRVHLQAEVEAAHRGRDVDNPPLLSRSVILS